MQSESTGCSKRYLSVTVYCLSNGQRRGGNCKQTTQAMYSIYSVTLGRVRVTIVARETQQFVLSVVDIKCCHISWQQYRYPKALLLKRNCLDDHCMTLVPLVADTILWQIAVVGNNQTCCVDHVMCLTFLLQLKQIWIFSTDFDKSHQHKSEENPFSQSRVDRYSRTDGHDDAKRRLSRLCQHSDKRAVVLV